MPRTEHSGTPQVRGDEEEMCGGMATADVRDERYEVNHYSERGNAKPGRKTMKQEGVVKSIKGGR